MKFYQACYGKPGNNWELFNLSPDTPTIMASFFEKLGSSCTPQNIGAENAVTSSGQPLCLYEIISNENVVCALKAQYGERDNFGRPKMFAHGFMFHAEEVLKNPNTILSIRDENFKFTTEETKVSPRDLVRADDIDADSALANLGITRDGYHKLLACVYYMLESATDFPLYILCDNNMETIKNAIYCILNAVPYSLRYQLSFANANSLQYANFKRVMFVDKVPDREYYYSLKTEETNIELSSELGKNPLYVNSVNMEKVEYAQYCEKIQETLTKMNCSYDATYSETYLADMLSKETDFLYLKEDTELVQALLDVLSKMPCQNTFIDDYLAGILGILEQRNLYVGESIMQSIEVLCNNTTSQNLIQIYKIITTKALAEAGMEEAVKFLSRQYVMGKEIFDDWCSYILKIEGGMTFIVEFYKKKILLCTHFSELLKLHEEAQVYCSSDDLMLAFKTQCFAIGKKQTHATGVCRLNYEEILREFKNSYITMVGGTSIELQSMIEEIKHTFWLVFRFEDFVFDHRCIENCTYMAICDEEKCDIFEKLAILYDAVDSYERGIVDYLKVERCLELLSNKLENVSRYEELIPLVQNYILTKMKQEGERHFCFWVKLARFGGKQKNPIYKMVKWKLPIICNVECFQNAFDESVRMQDAAERILIWLVGSDQNSGYLSKVEANQELYKTLKKEVKVLQEFKKRQIAAEKMKEKELRKLEKKKDKNAKIEERDEGILDDDFVVLDVEEVMQKKNDTPKKKGIFSVLDKMKR